ncbi:MAG: hypothetical protein OXQ29_21340 [Rhodospirillaceae bacterium]|nr:hypothetical protein [Rhodospirillaceae bacterium]
MKVLLAVLLVFASSCRGGDTTRPDPDPPDLEPPSPFGRYDLVSVAGGPLPRDVANAKTGQLEFRIHSQYLSIRRYGGYRSDADITLLVIGIRGTMTAFGDVSVDADTVTFMPNDGGCHDFASFQPGNQRLTIPTDCELGIEWIFEKRSG